MKRIGLLISAAALAVMTLASSVYAGDNASATASASFMSRYVWRGITLSKGSVIQPSIDFNKGGFNANLWANYDNDTTEHNETDLTLAYNLPVEAVGVKVGYIYYGLDGFDDTQEVFTTLSKELGPVTPYLSAYYDFAVGTGLFVQLGADYSTDINEKVSAAAGGSVSFQSKNEVVGGTDASGEGYSALHNGELHASVTVTPMEGVSVVPMAAYTFPLSTDAKDGIKGISYDAKDKMFYGGVTVSYGF